jgi:hypothetical protein
MQPSKRRSRSPEFQASYNDGAQAAENSSDFNLNEQITDPNVVGLEVRNDLPATGDAARNVTATAKQ